MNLPAGRLLVIAITAGLATVAVAEPTITPQPDLAIALAATAPLQVETLAGEFLGAVGPPNPNYQWEYRSVVSDGDWIYGRVGRTPWWLLGMNAKTRVSWYRFTDASMAAANGVEPDSWQRIDLPPVTLYPAPIRRMATLPGGSLFTLSEGYARALRFDPKTGNRTPLGSTMSVYSMVPFEGKIYLCGYPSSQVWIYDPQTAEVHPVGKMEQDPLLFVDGDIDVAGAPQFRRITGIPKVQTATP